MTTENRDYNVPESGEENWHEPVNENWHMIDADIQEALDMAYTAMDAATDDDDDDDESSANDPPDGAPERIDEQFLPSHEFDRQRNGEELDASDYDSLQAALDDMSEGDTIFVPKSDGPYEGFRWTNCPNHITIESDGALIEYANDSRTFRIDGGGFTDSVDVDGSIEEGSTSLEVDGSLSNYSVGDDIMIRDTEMWYRGRTPDGSGPDYVSRAQDNVGEQNVIADINGSTITLRDPTIMEYPNEGGLEVHRYDWSATDVRISGLKFDGLSTSNVRNGLELRYVRDPWLDNIESYTADRAPISFWNCRRVRGHDLHVENGLYGVRFASGTSHAYMTEISGADIDRYVATSTSQHELVPRINAWWRGIYAEDSGTACNSHFGGERNVFEDFEAVRCRYGLRDRSYNNEYRDFTVIDPTSTGRGCSDFSIAPEDTFVHGGELILNDQDPEDMTGLGVRLDSENDHGYGINLTFTNMQFPDDLRRVFRFSSDTHIDGLIVDDIFVGDEQWGWDEFLEESNRYDPDRINDVTINGIHESEYSG